MNIRLAGPLDLVAILQFDVVAQSDPGRTDFVRSAVEAGQAQVAVVDDAVVAYAVFDYSFFHRGFVSLVYVRPDFRRRGVASALMAQCEEMCSTARIFTSTNRSNLQMQSLLSKLGYQPSGIVENLDEDDPELIYCKRLERKSGSNLIPNQDEPQGLKPL